jgi:hypothetical protein
LFEELTKLFLGHLHCEVVQVGSFSTYPTCQSVTSSPFGWQAPVFSAEAPTIVLLGEDDVFGQVRRALG